MDLLEGGLKLVRLAMTFADSVGMLGGRRTVPRPLPPKRGLTVRGYVFDFSLLRKIN